MNEQQRLTRFFKDTPSPRLGAVLFDGHLAIELSDVKEFISLPFDTLKFDSDGYFSFNLDAYPHSYYFYLKDIMRIPVYHKDDIQVVIAHPIVSEGVSNMDTFPAVDYSMERSHV